MRVSSSSLAVIFAVSASAACGVAEAPEIGEPTPETLKAPEHGVQIRTTGVRIEPGTEIEYCEVLALPGEPTDVLEIGRLEAAMNPGSHHLIVSAVEPGSEMDQRIEVGSRTVCPLGARLGGEDAEEVFGSQAPYWNEQLPPGVGRRFFGGQKLIADYHYLNATRSPIDAKVALNFHLMAGGPIEHVVSRGGFYNFTIDIKPRERKSFFGECRFDEDVVMHKLVRHTHKWGRRFAVWFAGGARDGQLAFQSDHYEDTDHVFPEPFLMKRGEGFKFECEYLNTESHALVFGNTTRDEMCILFHTYWSPEPGREPPFEGCLLREIDGDGVARR